MGVLNLGVFSLGNLPNQLRSVFRLQIRSLFPNWGFERQLIVFQAKAENGSFVQFVFSLMGHQVMGDQVRVRVSFCRKSNINHIKAAGFAASSFCYEENSEDGDDEEKVRSDVCLGENKIFFPRPEVWFSWGG